MVFDQLRIERDIQYNIDKKAVYSLLGYKKERTKLSQKMADRIDSAFFEAEKQIETTGAYIIRRIKNKEERVTFFASEMIIEGQSVKNLLINSFAVIFMAVTIGSGLEKLADFYTKEKQFENALVLDTIGSEAAEASADALNSFFQTQARQAKQTLTRRFSPGYGDLPLSFQKVIFDELFLDKLGLSIDRKFILFPRKTVTALIGVEE